MLDKVGMPSGGIEPVVTSGSDRRPWTILHYCIQSPPGWNLHHLNIHSGAETSWQAIRDAQELLRSQKRSWMNFSAFRQIQKWPSAIRPVDWRSNMTTVSTQSGSRTISATLSEYDTSCASSVRTVSSHSQNNQLLLLPENQTVHSGNSILMMPFTPVYRQGGENEDSTWYSVTPQSGHHASIISDEIPQIHVSRSADAYSDQDNKGDALKTRENASISPFYLWDSSGESDRVVPAAASSLLRFPRIFPGYHFPPQPSAVPSAFFERTPAKKSTYDEKCENTEYVPQEYPRSKIQLLQCMLADTAAATIQRCIRGYFTRLRYQAALVWRRLLQQQQHRENEGAAKIQAAWRGLKARELLLYHKEVRRLQILRNNAAIKIQAFWKMRQQQMEYQTLHLRTCLVALRRLAAIEIQRVWRGFVTRRVLDEEWEKWVVKWSWDKPSAIVEVIGDFSSPPWTKRYLMTYCYIRDCFVLCLPRKPGRHEIKFIVNGRYVCDGNQTVIADGSGHFNNLVRVRAPTSSQFRIIRSRLKALELNNTILARSNSSPACAGDGNREYSHLLDYDNSINMSLEDISQGIYLGGSSLK